MQPSKKFYKATVNLLTLSRIPLSIIFIFLCSQLNISILYCCIVFLLIAATDFWDGQLARKLDVTSILGARLDVGCDFFFILLSSAALCRTNQMNIWFPAIISLKFLEFLFTSYWNKHKNNSQNVFLFDPFGRSLALLFYCIPILTMIINIVFPVFQNILLILTAVLSVLSSGIRIYSCLCEKSLR